MDWSHLIKGGTLLGSLQTREIGYVYDWWELLSISRMHAKELARVLSTRRGEKGTLDLVDIPVSHFFPGAPSWDATHDVPCPICNCVVHSAREAAVHFAGASHLRRAERASDFIKSVQVARKEPGSEHSTGAYKLEDYRLCNTCGILVNPDEVGGGHDRSKKHVAGTREALQESIVGKTGATRPCYRAAAVAGPPNSDRRILLEYVQRSMYIIHNMYLEHQALVAEIMTGREAYQDDSEDSSGVKG